MPRKGQHLSDKAKEKLRIAHLGKPLSLATRLKMSKTRRAIQASKGTNCICEMCGNQFYVKPYKKKTGRGKFCSKRCHSLSMLKRITRICKGCGKTFETSPSYIKRGYFCSNECYRSSRIGVPLSEEIRRKMSANAPMKQPGVAKKVSEALKGKPKPWMQGENNPAKRPEAREKISKALKGVDHRLEKNTRWLGGISFEPYCHLFNRSFKAECRESWGNVCIVCGQGPNGRNLHVHHVHYDKGAGCNGRALECVPLCMTHHLKTNSNRQWWTAYFEQRLWNCVLGWRTEIVCD